MNVKHSSSTHLSSGGGQEGRQGLSLRRSLATAGPRAAGAAHTAHGGHSGRLWRPAGAAHAQQHAQQQLLQPHGERKRSCRLYDLHSTLVPYQQAWDWQHQLVEQAIAGAGAGGQGRDSVLLLQHPPVFTLGTGSTTDNLLFDPADSPVPLYRTERGGEVTYHGPGQLVMYPILNLQRHRADLHWYMRSLEQVVVQALDEVSGLQGERVPGLTGVWVGGHKLAAIGIRAKRWVTYHGLALNVVTDLAPFRSIVPCGIAGRPVGSVRGLLDDQSMVDDPFLSDMGAEVQSSELLVREGAEVQSSELLVREYRYALLAAFAEIFDLELQEADAAADLPGAAAVLAGPRGGALSLGSS